MLNQEFFRTGNLFWNRGTSINISSTLYVQSESTLYSYQNVKELLARSRHEIWSLSDCNWTRTRNHLVRKRTFPHLAKLAKLAKWLSAHLRTKWLWVRVQLQSVKCHQKYTKRLCNEKCRRSFPKILLKLHYKWEL